MAQLDEKALRKEGFTAGTKVKLGDGQEWTFPLPWVRFYPVRDPDGKIFTGGGPSYGLDYEDRLEDFYLCDPDDVYTRISIRFELVTTLLLQNYNLTDRNLRHLLATDSRRPESAEMWTELNALFQGHSLPKASGDGSSSPS